MKTTLILACILLSLACNESATLSESSTPYEIVLVGEKVVFDKAETVSTQIVIRDLGIREVIGGNLQYGWWIVWDGKEYKRNPEHVGSPWNGPRQLIPKTTLRLDVSLADFLVPAQVLTPGRHTLSIKDASATSNTITVFIEHTK